MSIDQILDTMADHLKAQLPNELKTSEQVGGRIDLAEIQRRSLQMPAAYVTITGTREGRIVNNMLHCRGYFMCILAVMGKAEDGVLPRDRTRAIHRLLGRVMGVIAKAKDWGSPEVDGRPDVIAAVNSYRTQANKNNLALFGITWEQDLRLEDPKPLTLDDLLLVSADYQISGSNPEIDAEDEIEFTP